MIRTRFAPSPTGLLHAGNYRTALFAYLFARQNKGKFILRIEDTDKERSKKEYEDNILESLAWLGVEHDEMYRQSEKAGKHREYIEKLIAGGHAYISKNEGEGKREVIRLKNPGKVVSFDDMIRGTISIDTKDLGDFVIAKSLDEPVFHLAVVCDDADSGITHVIRGEDHISNTPRHILIAEALGFPIPTYAHVPLLLAPDRSKLSKRRGAKAITEYRDAGFLSEALFNFMVLLGWNPGGEQEIFTKDELIKLFDLSKVQKGGAIFNEEKLLWFNKEHLKRRPEAKETIAHMLQKALPEAPKEAIERFVPLAFERINTYDEVNKYVQEGEYSFLTSVQNLDPKKLIWKDSNAEEAGRALAESIKLIEGLDTDTLTSAEKIKSVIFPIADTFGRGKFLWPLRMALSGKDKSPDPFSLIYILGKTEAIKRITDAKNLLDSSL